MEVVILDALEKIVEELSPLESAQLAAIEQHVLACFLGIWSSVPVIPCRHFQLHRLLGVGDGGVFIGSQS